jgi:hypothetical protein
VLARRLVVVITGTESKAIVAVCVEDELFEITMLVMIAVVEAGTV